MLLFFRMWKNLLQQFFLILLRDGWRQKLLFSFKCGGYGFGWEHRCFTDVLRFKDHFISVRVEFPESLSARDPTTCSFRCEGIYFLRLISTRLLEAWKQLETDSNVSNVNDKNLVPLFIVLTVASLDAFTSCADFKPFQCTQSNRLFALNKRSSSNQTNFSSSASSVNKLSSAFLKIFFTSGSRPWSFQQPYEPKHLSVTAK